MLTGNYLHSNLFIQMFFFPLEDFSIGRFDCSSSPGICTDLYILKKPAFILFKRGGHYEFYYGKSLFVEQMIE